jgi:tetratricopeptide (TPR) repeat protein
MQAKFDAAAADAKTAYAAAANPFSAAGIAAFIGDETSRAHQYEEALKWYRTALRVQTPSSGAVAYRAAKLAREKLNRETDAKELFQAACRAGNKEACKETGGSPLPRLRRRAGAG